MTSNANTACVDPRNDAGPGQDAAVLVVREACVELPALVPYLGPPEDEVVIDADEA
jgi:hypothetical protein